MAEKQIAIDGKKECGTAPREKGPKGDYLLNAYVAENALFIGQEKLTDKENEIPAIPRLLDKLEIKDAIISIDAMGTHVEIAKKIFDMWGGDIISLQQRKIRRDYCLILRMLYNTMSRHRLMPRPKRNSPV